MASEITDAFVRFGKGSDEKPMIAGESTDSSHFSWCELKNCGFELKAVEEKDEFEHEHSKAVFNPVKLTKRIDRASAKLFTRCCPISRRTKERAGKN